MNTSTQIRNVARGKQQAGAYLRLLLQRDGRYRRTWRRHLRRERPGGALNQDAIARVLADHAFDNGDDNADHRSLNDTVRRALGNQLSSAALDLFIDAFAMDESDADTLRRLLDGRSGAVVVSDVMLPTALTDRPEPGYETRSLHEVHRLGPDGLPAEHRTSHVIRSAVPDLDSYLYLFDTSAALVEIDYGGTSGELQRFDEQLYGVAIRLTKPLALGETARIEYRTTFGYTSAPPPEFRRAALRRPIQNLSLRVEFHPHRLPKAVWWGEWAHLNNHAAQATHDEPAALNKNHSVERNLDYVEHAIVGFHWSWTTPPAGQQEPIPLD